VDATGAAEAEGRRVNVAMRRARVAQVEVVGRRFAVESVPQFEAATRPHHHTVRGSRQTKANVKY